MNRSKERSKILKLTEPEATGNLVVFNKPKKVKGRRRRYYRCSITHGSSNIKYSSDYVAISFGMKIKHAMDPRKNSGFIKCMDIDGNVKWYIHPVTREKISIEEFIEKEYKI